jgi:hypothetical protein
MVKYSCNKDEIEARLLAFAFALGPKVDTGIRRSRRIETLCGDIGSDYLGGGESLAQKWNVATDSATILKHTRRRRSNQVARDLDLVTREVRFVIGEKIRPLSQQLVVLADVRVKVDFFHQKD